MRILVDMDDVLAGFDERFLELWREQHPDEPYVPLEERTKFYVADEYSKDLKPLIEAVYHAPGFCLSLPPIPGGKEALEEMKSLGHEVFICTAPLSHYENCVLEKYLWTERHLGRPWTKKIILTKDKTLIRGDILIDDKPDITGVDTPTWEHILYDKPYNRHLTGRKRMTDWRAWKAVLGLPSMSL